MAGRGRGRGKMSVGSERVTRARSRRERIEIPELSSEDSSYDLSRPRIPSTRNPTINHPSKPVQRHIHMQLPISHTYYQLTKSNGVNSAPYKICTYPSPYPYYMYTTNQNYSLGATLPKQKK